MHRYTIGLFALVACGGDSNAIEQVCAGAAECGVIMTNETGACTKELDAVNATAGSRPASECLECIETMQCGMVADGYCADECGPLVDPLKLLPGTVSGACTGTSTKNYAMKLIGGSNKGSLGIELGDCMGGAVITAGPYFNVGDSKPCGMFEGFFGNVSCSAATGTIQIIEKEARRWVKGSCSCSNMSVQFEVPYRLSI